MQVPDGQNASDATAFLFTHKEIHPHGIKVTGKDCGAMIRRGRSLGAPRSVRASLVGRFVPLEAASHPVVELTASGVCMPIFALDTDGREPPRSHN